MGIAERKEKEKVGLKKLILQAALDVYLENGYEDTTVRNIAERIEYSPTTIYLYYKDKDAILYALHQYGFQLLAQKLDAHGPITDPYERLLAMGREYIDFALNNLALYDLMFIKKAPILALEMGNHKWSEGIAAFERLKETVNECSDQGILNLGDVETASFVIWSAMHGMCALYIGGRCLMVLSEERRGDILRIGFENFLGILAQLKNENANAKTITH